MLVDHLLPSGFTRPSRKPGLLYVARFRNDRGIRLGASAVSLSTSSSSSAMGGSWLAGSWSNNRGLRLGVLVVLTAASSSTIGGDWLTGR